MVGGACLHQLYGPKSAEPSIAATVAGNYRVTEIGHDYDTHHIVLDFGAMPSPVLEGQVDWHPAARPRCRRPPTSSATILGRQSAQR